RGVSCNSLFLFRWRFDYLPMRSRGIAAGASLLRGRTTEAGHHSAVRVGNATKSTIIARKRLASAGRAREKREESRRPRPESAQPDGTRREGGAPVRAWAASFGMRRERGVPGYPKIASIAARYWARRASRSSAFGRCSSWKATTVFSPFGVTRSWTVVARG